MVRRSIVFLIAAVTMLDIGSGVRAQEPVRDYTCFQTETPYSPALDLGSDMAIVYGVNETFASRVTQWREKNYAVGMMTGIAWGDYGEYFGAGETFKKDEVQTRNDGSLYMHGPDVGYNVPTKAYTEFMKRLVEKAVDAGVRAIFLEEPEFWVKTGWSPAFKRMWEDYYREPWQPPDSSPAAQYMASKLKYKLYYDTVAAVCQHIDAYAAQNGASVECVVPTHSMLNYAHWQIVSPETRLLDIPELDGYVAQVWTGTARTANNYRGVLKERTFETAYFEYGQMAAMVRPTGRKLWFLADPVEDNPNRSWNDYKHNYECTVVASLMWPDVSRFEVMPWPSRIFQGKYPKVDLESKTGEREGIAADYATEILTVINALNEMAQCDVRYDTGNRGIGILVSDTMMFQRESPGHSDWGMGFFYGLALPLLKAGIPLEPVQLENVTHEGLLDSYKVLLLSYDGQKPPARKYHKPLARWVKDGGCLLYVGDGADPFHDVPEWWNKNGKSQAKAYQDLFDRLGVDQNAFERPKPAGRGFVRVLAVGPTDLSMSPDGPEKVLEAVSGLFGQTGGDLEIRNYLSIRRGPFVVAAVLDESVSEAPLVLEGAFVDLFDAALPAMQKRSLRPGQHALLYDLEWARENGLEAKVVAAACRIKNENLEEGVFHFTTHGPADTIARVRVLLPSPPKCVTNSRSAQFEHQWDEKSRTLVLTFLNCAEDVVFTIELCPKDSLICAE